MAIWQWRQRFFKVFIFEKIFYNICKDSKKPMPPLPRCHPMRMIKLLLKRRKTRRLKIKQQNQLIKQRQGSLNGFRIIQNYF